RAKPRRAGMTGEADGTFAGVGGVAIYYQRAAPGAGVPRGVVLIAHGYAEHLGRYREFVAHLTGRGFAAAAVDHRGHGRSGGPRGHCRTFAEFVADLRTLADLAEGWWPGVPRLLFGHSMGGLIAFLYLLRHPETMRAGRLQRPPYACRTPRRARCRCSPCCSGGWRPAPGCARTLPNGSLRADPP